MNRRDPNSDDNAPSVVLTPIPGKHLDPDSNPSPAAIDRLDQRAPWVGVAWKAYERFKVSQASLLAAGTAYYGFIAMFSLLALAYGVASLLSADSIAHWLTTTLESALPGMVGDQGIDPATLERVGRASSLVGLVTLAISGAAVMGAASNSIHQIYGAPPNGRNPARLRLYLLSWLAVLGPLVALSYSLSTVISGFGTQILEEIGLTSSITRAALVVLGTALTFALDVWIVALMLSRLGGIDPGRAAVVPAAMISAVVIGVFKSVTAAVVSWSVDKPQYGSFAIPVTVLLVMWVQSMALYAGAAVAAARAVAAESHSDPQVD